MKTGLSILTVPKKVRPMLICRQGCVAGGAAFHIHELLVEDV